MPSYNFNKWIATSIENGTIRQSIRPCRKIETKVGDTLQLYRGQRTRNPRLLMTAVCVGVDLLSIYDKKNIVLGDRVLTDEEILALMKQDGYTNRDSFINFYDYTYGLPFHGVLIRW
jgi:hypothetical protein